MYALYKDGSKVEGNYNWNGVWLRAMFLGVVNWRTSPITLKEGYTIEGNNMQIPIIEQIKENLEIAGKMEEIILKELYEKTSTGLLNLVKKKIKESK